jgi:hypothetical protein
VLVRHDVDLRKVGEVADLPFDSSPIQIGTTGSFEEKAFTVTGRIVYEYEQGTWNEWHLAFADNTSGWLSDAQAEYALSRLVAQPGELPPDHAVTTGQRFAFGGMTFTVATRTNARYRGVDGELPFEYWDKDTVLFADLKAADGHFATLDYSESPPLLFIGLFVEFDQLELSNLTPAESPRAGKIAGFNCRNCGAAIELRALEMTKTVACTSCAAIQDPHDPNLLVLQESKAKERVKPTIPLGSRGTLHGHEFEAIGFAYRTIEVEGEEYGWKEYVLFNRQQGFRYLSEYEGHWNDIRTVRAVPQAARSGGNPAASYLGRTYRLFQRATATVRFVLGEFPWQVKSGDVATVSDYVAPPMMLSAEKTPDETTWSIGEYVNGRDLWQAFHLPGSAPKPVGVFANQPSPYAGKPAYYWGLFLVLALILFIVGAFRTFAAAREPVFAGSYLYRAGAVESSFVTPVFTIGNRTSNLEVRTTADVQNNWIGFDYALINADTGDAFDFSREVSYYWGTDSDGRWTEGSQSDSAVLPTIAPGRYYLRVEPETDATSPPVSYRIALRRDVPSPEYYLMALGVLLIPPVLISLRSAAFESRRWQESDFGDQNE